MPRNAFMQQLGESSYQILMKEKVRMIEILKKKKNEVSTSLRDTSI